MKNRFLLLFTISCSLFTIRSYSQDAEQIYKKVNDAVVTVYAYDSYQKILSQGSGVVLNDKGWIVTNYHVYNGSDKMVVRHNGKIVEYTAIIGVDADKDILILKIADHTFPSIAIGNSDLLNVGQKIYAIGGSPMGFENTMTEGIVSGLRSYEANTHNYIQISAAISHGSSGGAIVNAKGELIGISTLSVVDGQNLNFAIPVNEVMKVYKEGGVKKDDLTAEDYFYKGMKEAQSGNKNKAINYYVKAISIKPNFVEALYNLGNQYYGDDKNTAISYYQKAISIDPNFVYGYNALGDAFLIINADKAISYFKQALGIDPNFINAIKSLGWIYLVSKGDYESAFPYYKRAIELNPNDAESYNGIAGCYYGKGDNYNSKLNYEKAYELNPSLRK